MSSSDGNGCASGSEVDVAGRAAGAAARANAEIAVAVIPPALDRAVIEDGAGVVAPARQRHRVPARANVHARGAATVGGCAVAELTV